EDGIRDRNVTGVQTCALPISSTGTRSFRKSSGERVPPANCVKPPPLRRWTTRCPECRCTAVTVTRKGKTKRPCRRRRRLNPNGRSEERRVGKEERWGWGRTE